MPDFLSVRTIDPTKSTASISTVSSSGTDDGEALQTPGVESNPDAGWLSVSHPSDGSFDSSRSLWDTSASGTDVDKFIVKTLLSADKSGKPNKSDHYMHPEDSGLKARRPPGTPVKKLKTKEISGGGKRPWASAIAAKRIDTFGMGPSKSGISKPPRKSTPAGFPSLSLGLGAITGKPREKTLNKENVPLPLSIISPLEDTDDEGEENSPSLRKDKGLFAGMGFGLGGRTNTLGSPKGGSPVTARRSAWLSRRNSSGQFSISSGSEGVCTPTRPGGLCDSILYIL